VTNGFNDIVDPVKLTKNFNFLLENPIVATDVVVKMMLHMGLKWYNEQFPVNDYSCMRNVGNVSKESSITFEYGMSEVDIGDLKTLPFQVQIHFTRLDGAKCIRLLSHKQDVTENRDEAELNVNIGVIGLHSVQQTAKIVEDGDYTKARLKTITNQKLVKRVLKKRGGRTEEDEKQYTNWMTEAEKMDKVIKKAQKEDMEDNFSDEDDEGETIKEYDREKEDRKMDRQKKRKQLRTKDDQFSNVMYHNQNPMTSLFK